MEKNENGYPLSAKKTENGKTKLDISDDMALPENTMDKNKGTDSNRMMDNGCGEMSDNCLDSRPLAYVYAPNQRFCMLYSASDALDHGTLFEALYKPMEVYGRE